MPHERILLWATGLIACFNIYFNHVCLSENCLKLELYLSGGGKKPSSCVRIYIYFWNLMVREPCPVCVLPKGGGKSKGDWVGGINIKEDKKVHLL